MVFPYQEDQDPFQTMKIKVYFWRGKPNQFAATHSGRTMAGQYYGENHVEEILKRFRDHGWITEGEEPEIELIPQI
jgi:hypothetical protein